MSRSEEELLQAERRRMAAAFGEVLDEPVPGRLKALLAEPTAQVVDLGAVRVQRKAMSSWAAWGGMAATLVLGTLLGTRLAPSDGDALDRGRLVATGAIARALDRQLASAPEAGAAVAVQLSFKARDGRWCRSFTTAASAGLACREGDGSWALQQVAAVTAAPAGGMRQAASALPPSVLAAVDGLMAGAALGPEQERAARDAGWR
ncbi:hypothetical protein [Roseateles saccharophilus]|uniref:Anti-sigma factor NepR domain-containing protein n=1 Tax=Roseateles saccharophilus TaxID=304 RepID=A0A4R3UIY5_ROSSA|nr:hypothetical protein [Roseateles saccharophilus]MDG0835082.1 hypothetical protein [Roseateles saccharophilus]TCU88260.1 hypothetical protein EV671_10429 [Roseateles saccharophilus]